MTSSELQDAHLAEERMFDIEAARERDEDAYEDAKIKEQTGLTYDELLGHIENGTVTDAVRRAAMLFARARADTPRPEQDPKVPCRPEWIGHLIEAEMYKLINNREDVGGAQLNAAAVQAEKTVLARFGLEG
jgi:hypothetical protein